MFKLFLYGYLNRIQSSRRLEREAGRNVELMWLLGRLAPELKTTADFRSASALLFVNAGIHYPGSIIYSCLIEIVRKYSTLIKHLKGGTAWKLHHFG